MSAKQNHNTYSEQEAALLKQLGYMADHPGTLGLAFAYMQRLEVERAELRKRLADALAYIEMTLAHRGCMSVAEIVRSLEDVRKTSEIETGHHLGCNVTTRRVDLAAIRRLLAIVAPQPEPSRWTIEYRREVGRWEVKEGAAHRGLCETREAAARLVAEFDEGSAS